MSTYTLHQLPIILRYVNASDAPKVLRKIESEYRKGVDFYNQLLDKCRHATDDAYPSYLN